MLVLILLIAALVVGAIAAWRRSYPDAILLCAVGVVLLAVAGLVVYFD